MLYQLSYTPFNFLTLCLTPHLHLLFYHLLIANLSPSSIAIGCVFLKVIAMLSPGMTISVPDGNSTEPVTSVVCKKLRSMYHFQKCMYHLLLSLKHKPLLEFFSNDPDSQTVPLQLLLFVPLKRTPTLSPASPWSSNWNISTPVQVVFVVSFNSTISLSSNFNNTPFTRPATTVPSRD